MWNTPINRLRLIGLFEGLSFILLLGVAMPLKYHWGEPMAVRIVGSAHGVLWIGLCAILSDTVRREGWTARQACLPFVASLLPFGPFLIDGKLKALDRGGD